MYMNKNIQYIIENIINFNPANFNDDENDIIDAQTINSLIWCPKTSEELQELVAKRLAEKPENPYLLDIDTSEITDMSGLFASRRNSDHGNPKYNKYLSKYYISSINIKELNLATWNTSNVTNMNYMFSDCESLEALNISSFNTSKVVNMEFMFYHCESIKELDLTHFDVSSVERMCYMFCACESLKKLNLSGWNTSNVETMRGMF